MNNRLDFAKKLVKNKKNIRLEIWLNPEGEKMLAFVIKGEGISIQFLADNKPKAGFEVLQGARRRRSWKMLGFKFLEKVPKR